MVEGSQGVDLVVKEVLFDLVLNFSEFNYFYGHLFIVLLVYAFVYFGTKTGTHHIRRVVNEVFDFLCQLLLLLLVCVSCGFQTP